MQEVPTIFETDLFAPIVSAVIARARKSNPKLPEELDGRQTQAARAISDHTRALAFLLADGFTPSNEGAGYVLRRVLRRAYRFGRRFGVEGPFLKELVPAIVDTMGPVYPELVGAQSRVGTWIEQEERQFEETLERSFGPLVSTIEKAKSRGLGVLPGEDAFRLHDTYGLPMELAAEIAGEYGLTLDAEGFEHAMAQQRERARARSEEDFAFAVRSGYQSFSGKTTFLGYHSCGAQGTVIGIVRDGEPAEGLGEGEEGEVFLDQSPFYAGAGGQVGDHGTLSGEGFAADVLDTHYPVEGAHAHKVRVTSGTLKTAQQVNAQVDEARRQAIARAHTATHLLHHMLRDVLGDHAVQSGSLVDADRLRFDFAHFSALTEEEKRRIEEGVLELALADSDLDTQEMSREDAQRGGAVALFGEKYGAQVRVVQIGSFSRELCGGTHLAHAGAIGGFSIVSEGSIGAGLRRIEAVTGREAQKLALSHRERLASLAATLDTPPEKLGERVDVLREELRAARRELEGRKKREFEAYVTGSLDTEIREQSETVEGINFLVMRVADMPSDDLRDLADRAVSTIEPGVVVVGCEHDGRAQFAARVSKDLVKEGLHAGNLIREVAKIAGGGGGGRPDFAQAGGKNPERLDEALAKAKELVAAQKG
jgi:alanyl-tRNA synthetase